MAFDDIVLSDRVIALARAHASPMRAQNMMDEVELREILKCLIASAPGDDEIVLELGTFRGNTAALVASALEQSGKQTTVVSVDAFDMIEPNATNPQGVLSAFLESTARFRERVVAVRAFTEVARKFLRPGCAAVAILDAYHELDAVRADIPICVAALRTGGYLFLDDYNASTYPGVFQAANELLVDAPGIETVKLTSYYAVFRKS